jgi:hypothetical protein
VQAPEELEVDVGPEVDVEEVDEEPEVEAIPPPPAGRPPSGPELHEPASRVATASVET